MEKFLEECRVDSSQPSSHQHAPSPQRTLPPATPPRASRRTPNAGGHAGVSDPEQFTLFRHIRARARAASQIWAEENHDLVELERAGGDIGVRQATVARMFDALPSKVREVYERQAEEGKRDMNSHIDQCYA